jgi:cathepsin B
MGSLPDWAWSFLQSTGVVSEDCVGYSGSPETIACEAKCTKGSDFRHYKVKSYRHVAPLLNPQDHMVDMMAEVMRGPVDVTFNVYGDFDDYWSKAGTPGFGKVYTHNSGSYEGLHSVKVIGWGTDDKEGPYWIVANSWGKTGGVPGDPGYFWIRRGTDECSVESMMYTGDPDLDFLD